MEAPRWLTRSAAELPPGLDWLGERERDAVASLRFERRRGDWLLGRHAAKAAVAAALGVAPGEVEVLAAAGGAPEAWVGAERAPVALSLSHRAGRALAVVAAGGTAVGCDIEAVEPRSGAFVREWLAPAEQERVAAACDDAGRALAANLIWTAKEAAAKLRGEGLRLNVRTAVATPEEGRGDWKPLAVAWDGAALAGWWRAEPGWVMSVVGDPPGGAPVAA